MYPLLLMKMIEKADPAFLDLFYPEKYRCRLDKRIVQAIDEEWFVYFPTRKECRGKNWALTIPEGEPKYKPDLKTRKKLVAWKKSITGTIAEIRQYHADHSWRRLDQIAKKSERLRPLVKLLRLLTKHLTYEESMWPNFNGLAVGQNEYCQAMVNATLAPGSQYLRAEPARLKQVRGHIAAFKKIQLINQMRTLLDHPLMTLAILEKCLCQSPYSRIWLSLGDQINAIAKKQSKVTFRKTWLEHAISCSGAVDKSGKPSRRRWSEMLLTFTPDGSSAVDEKAIEVHKWLTGKKLPSLETIRRSWLLVLAQNKSKVRSVNAAADIWLLSWMVSLWLESHFQEIDKAFNGNRRNIQNYYLRFFHYLENV